MLMRARHTLVSETARRFGEMPPCTLTIISDVPKGTGLGSSSSLSVALCSLMLGEVDERSLVEYAYGLEIGVNPGIGIQDFLPPIFGGFNIYNINPNANLDVKRVPDRLWDIVNTRGLLLYTGINRESSRVLKSLRSPRAMTEYLSRIQGLASVVADNIESMTPETLGHALNLTWKFKSSIAEVSSLELNKQYDEAISAGAIGGKLCGAGAGGCWFFIVPPNRRDSIKKALGLTEISFQISDSPVKAVAV